MNVDFNLIRQKGYDTFRYLRINDQRTEQTFKEFLAEGKKATGFARLMLNEARNLNEDILYKNALEDGRTIRDAKANVRELAHKFEFLNDTQKSKVRSFYRAFKRQYPKTWRQGLQ